ncbi:MAG: hypothetical protein LJE70_18590 [Chromatiaceae bacterium]|nr:hypothetical protein [Chromatiaceae bacterium]
MSLDQVTAGTPPVEAGYSPGVRLGAGGTPAIALPKGVLVSGCVNAAALYTRLGIGDVSAGR